MRGVLLLEYNFKYLDIMTTIITILGVLLLGRLAINALFVIGTAILGFFESL